MADISNKNNKKSKLETGRLKANAVSEVIKKKSDIAGAPTDSEISQYIPADEKKNKLPKNNLTDNDKKQKTNNGNTTEKKENNININKDDKPEIVRRRFTSTGEEPYEPSKTIEKLKTIKEKINEEINVNPNLTIEEKQKLKELENNLDNQVVEENRNAMRDLSKIKEVVESGDKDKKNIDITTEDIIKLKDEIPDEYYFDIDDPEKYNTLQQLYSTINSSEIDPVEPAIEKLGIRYYFPDIDQSILVGTTTTKTYGSGGVYVGGGALFPGAIVDARKRALEKAAANKAKSQEDLLSLMSADTSPMYQQQLDDIQYDVFEKYAKLVDYDINKIKSNNKLFFSFLRDARRLKTAGIEMKEAVTNADEIIKSATKKDEEVPPEILKFATLVKSGRLDLEEYMKNPSKYNKVISSMKKYKNYNVVIADKASKIQQSEVPLNFADMSAFKTKDELKDAIAKINSGNANLFIEGAMKFISDERLDKAARDIYEHENIYIPPRFKTEKEKIEYIKKSLLSEVSKQDMTFTTKLQNLAKQFSVNIGSRKEKTSFFRNYKEKYEINKGKMLSILEKDPSEKSKKEVLNTFGSIFGITPKSTNSDRLVGYVPQFKGKGREVAVDLTNPKVFIKDKDGNAFISGKQYISKYNNDEKDYVVSASKSGKPLDGYKIKSSSVVLMKFPKGSQDMSEATVVSATEKVDLNKYDVVPMVSFMAVGERKTKVKVYDVDGNAIKEWKVVGEAKDNEHVELTFSSKKDAEAAKSQLKSGYIEEVYKMNEKVVPLQPITMFYDMRYENDVQAADALFSPENQNLTKQKTDIFAFDN